MFSAARLHAVEMQPLTRLSPHSFGRLADDERSSNSAVFLGDEAALLVDPGLTPTIASRFLQQVRGVIGDTPIRYVVLTHWHPDHALGALCVLGPGVQLIAHSSTSAALRQRAPGVLARMAQAARDPDEKRTLESCQPIFPGHLVDDTEDIDLGGNSVRVFHPGHGHTAGDLVVWSAAERVLATGDLFMHAASPYMGEADPRSWQDILDRLVTLHPLHVVAGHFGLSRGEDLVRFRDYMHALVGQVETALARGVSVAKLGSALELYAFADFAQFPQYRATFAGNAADVARTLQSSPPARTFTMLARLKVGKNPHQISFSADGATAYVAAAGSDRITLVDTKKLTVTEHLDTPGVPLGVIPLGDGHSLAVTRFRGVALWRYTLPGGRPDGQLHTGGSPSLIQGPYPGNHYLIAVEKANKLWWFNAARFTMDGEFDTGKRPFPAAATHDGKLALVPNYDDGSVTIIDLPARRVVATVAVGKHPSGGVVLPGDAVYEVAVRGENRIALLGIESARVVGEIRNGIGQ